MQIFDSPNLLDNMFFGFAMLMLVVLIPLGWIMWRVMQITGDRIWSKKPEVGIIDKRIK